MELDGGDAPQPGSNQVGQELYDAIQKEFARAVMNFEIQWTTWLAVSRSQDTSVRYSGYPPYMHWILTN